MGSTQQVSKPVADFDNSPPKLKPVTGHSTGGASTGHATPAQFCQQTREKPELGRQAWQLRADRAFRPTDLNRNASFQRIR